MLSDILCVRKYRSCNDIKCLTLEPPNGSFVTHGGVSLITAPVPFQRSLRFSVTFPKFMSCVPWRKITFQALLVFEIWLDIPRSPDGSKLTHETYQLLKHRVWNFVLCETVWERLYETMWNRCLWYVAIYTLCLKMIETNSNVCVSYMDCPNFVIFCIHELWRSKNVPAKFQAIC